MKIVTLIPVKNEAWILPWTLKNISSFSDVIIIADQSSTDGSLEIYNKFEKVKVIKNPHQGHSNLVRKVLLEEARKIEGNNLIFCIDADEMISPTFVEKIKKDMEAKDSGVAISLPWIQLFRSPLSYRCDSVWKDNFKQIAFLDDRKSDYDSTYVINDHTSRIPKQNMVAIYKEYPLLHFQFIAWEKSQIKQAWYMCSELIQSLQSVRKINYRYSSSILNPTCIEKTPESWYEKIKLPKAEIFESGDEERLKEIFDFFNEKGILFFEPLDIWHIKELSGEFVRLTGRKPNPKKFPKILIFLNNLRHKILV